MSCSVVSTACEQTMLILSIPVTFSVTCLTVASLITKSCQQRWPIHSCSFYKVVHQQIWGVVVDFTLHVVKGAGSYLAGMAVAIPILNVDGRRHTNNFSKKY